MMKTKGFMDGTRATAVVLGVALVLVLFPFEWFGLVWPWLGAWLNGAGGGQGVHVAGHVGVFWLAGTAVIRFAPALRQRPWLYAAILIALAIGQEMFQLLSFKHHGLTADEWFDWSMDLVGIGLAFWLAQRTRYQTEVQVS